MKERLKSPRARLFVALEPPDAARAGLVAWRDALAAAVGPDLRPVRADALHVTLAFIGYRAERQIDAIAAAVGRATAGRPAVALEFLPEPAPRPPRRPRLYAAPLRDRDDLSALRAAIADKLTGARLFEDERREFWPHFTLGRVKSSARDHRTPDHLPAAPAALLDGVFAAGAVTLYRSHLDAAGARYESLAEFALAAGPLSAPG